MQEEQRRRRVLLASLAHPDDESFGLGGTLARYSDSGADVWLICATGGEAGVNRLKEARGEENLPHIREDELHCAKQVLKIKGVCRLGYRDSGMLGSPDNQHPNSLMQADEEEVVGQIVEIIRKVRPQVVITFDRQGGYGHPDHVAMHRYTTAAFYAAGDPDRFPKQIEMGLSPYQPMKLYYLTRPRSLMQRLVAAIRAAGRDPTHLGYNRDVDLTHWGVPDEEVTTRIDITRYRLA
ncbi:MAG TPA: GlcNAc-PI de-N-acetylase, partial [Anaerolineae bacterium]|nr:GlcNAc-PI de-N-acetylase [Anaerolineae bacterium]